MSFLIKNFFGFFRASRVPNLFVMAFVQALSAKFILSISINEIISKDFFALVLSTVMVAAAGYIINDYYDQKIDMINRPQKVIVGISLGRRFAIILHIILSILAVIIGWFLSPSIAVIHITSTFLLWYYSNSLRRLPLIGNLVIASLSGLILLIVGIFFEQTDSVIIVYAFFAFFISIIREMVKDIEDVKGEAAFGCKTIPVLWGIRVAKMVILVTSFIGVLLLGYFLIQMATSSVRFYFLGLTPVFIWFLYLLLKSDTQRHYRSLHTACNWIIFFGMISIFFLND